MRPASVTPEVHTTLIQSDQPVSVHVAPPNDGRWFRLPSALVSTGLLARLTPSAVSVLLVLASHADSRGHCWPSVPRLGKLSGLSRAQVYRALVELESSALVIRRTTGGGKRSTTYELLQPAAPAPPQPVSPVRPPPSHRCDPPRLTHETRTRSIELNQQNKGPAERPADRPAAAPPPPATSPGPAPAAADQVVEVLTAAGISEPTRSRLAELPGITPALVEKEVSRARERGKGPGVVVNSIRSAIEAQRAKERASRASREVASRASRASRAEVQAVVEERAKVRAFIASLSPERLRAEASAVLASLPAFTRRTLEQADPRTSPIVASAIYRRCIQTPVK